MPDKIVDAVLAEAKKTSDVSQDVLKSGAYLYPLKVGYEKSCQRAKANMFQRGSFTLQPTRICGNPLPNVLAQPSAWV